MLKRANIQQKTHIIAQFIKILEQKKMLKYVKGGVWRLKDMYNSFVRFTFCVENGISFSEIDAKKKLNMFLCFLSAKTFYVRFIGLGKVSQNTIYATLIIIFFCTLNYFFRKLEDLFWLILEGFWKINVLNDVIQIWILF